VRPSGGRVGAELVKAWSSWVDAGGALAVEEEAGQGLNRRAGDVSRSMTAASWKDRGRAAAGSGDGRGRVLGGRSGGLVVGKNGDRVGCEKDAVSFFFLIVGRVFRW
jgi:hypothetical protein